MNTPPQKNLSWYILGIIAGIVLTGLIWWLLNVFMPEKSLATILAAQKQAGTTAPEITYSGDEKARLQLTGGKVEIKDEFAQVEFDMAAPLGPKFVSPDDFYQIGFDIDQNYKTGINFAGLGIEYFIHCTTGPVCSMSGWSTAKNSLVPFDKSLVDPIIEGNRLLLRFPAFFLAQSSKIDCLLRAGNDKLKFESRFSQAGATAVEVKSSASELTQYYEKKPDYNRSETTFLFSTVSGSLDLAKAGLIQQGSQLQFRFFLKQKPLTTANQNYEFWLDTDANPKTGQPVRDLLGVDYIVRYRQNKTTSEALLLAYQDKTWKPKTEVMVAAKFDETNLQLELSLNLPDLGNPRGMRYLVHTNNETQEAFWPYFGYLNWITSDNGAGPTTLEIARLNNLLIDYDGYYLNFSFNEQENRQFLVLLHTDMDEYYTLAYDPATEHARLYRWVEKNREGKYVFSISNKKGRLSIPLYLLNGPRMVEIVTNIGTNPSLEPVKYTLR